MRLIKVILFLLLPISIKAQSSLLQYDNKAREISTISDHNERKYKLATFAEDFTLELTNQPLLNSLNNFSFIKSSQSTDKKYTVLYFNAYANNVVNSVHWFIISKQNNKTEVVYSYLDKIKFDPKHDGNGELELNILQRSVSNTTIYPLQFTFKTSSTILQEFSDIATICMFEQIKKLNTTPERIELNRDIINRLEILWSDANNFANDFKDLKWMTTLFSDDKKIKICTWNLPLSNSSVQYFGAIIVNSLGNIKVTLLNDDTKSINNPERANLTPQKWYGAIYYDIFVPKHKSNKGQYILLGYKPNNEMTKKKVIECMQINNNGKITFGNSIFQSEKGMQHRVVYEYGASYNMLLQYDSDDKKIIMDNLSSSHPMHTHKRYWGPDFSYNAYIWENDKWILTKDIEVKNPKANNSND